MPPAEKSAKPIDPAAQVDRFIETARALECDEDKERFEAKLKRIAKTKTRGKKSAEGGEC